MLIRRERHGDAAAIAEVHASAFQPEAAGGEPVEVQLVEQLRHSEAWLPRMSLVAVTADEIVGHVVCSRATIAPAGEPVLGLAPIGVCSELQGQGIGSALMHAVLGAADACDEPLVGLVGEPAYYRRFGFVPAARLGIEAPDPSWAGYFQVRPLATFTSDTRGSFRYAPPFDNL